MVSYKIILLVFLSLGGANFGPVEPCSYKIEVYYATWCRHCKHLIADQFGSSQDLLEEVAHVTLIPTGFVSAKPENGTWNFKCGPDNCAAGKVHACIVNLLPRNDALEAIICLEQQTDLEDGLVTCGEKLEFDPYSVMECAVTLGMDYLTQFGEIIVSLDPPLQGYPMIVVNEARDTQIADDMRQDIRKALCSRCSDPKPEECKD